MDKSDLLRGLREIRFQLWQRIQRQGVAHLSLHPGKLLLYPLAPDKRVPSGGAFQLRAVDKHCFVVSLALFLQQADILIEQILNLLGAALPKPRESGVIRHVFVLQQPHEIHTIPTVFL